MIARLIAIIMLSLTVGCVNTDRLDRIEQRLSQLTTPSVAYPQQSPDAISNLSPEDYAEMSGLDASTEQTLREQVRNNDLAWRVEKLEREVRRLNQRIYGVAELRIGDEGPQPQVEEEGLK